MSLYTMTADTVRVLRFVQQHIPLAACANMTAIGLERDGELVAGTIYEGFNGHNVWMHVAIPGRITPAYLRYCFHYPFIELGCARASCATDSRPALWHLASTWPASTGRTAAPIRRRRDGEG